MVAVFKGVSQGELMYLVLLFIMIVLIVLLIFLFPGTHEIYWGKMYPVGITASVIDQGNLLKLNLLNNYGGDIVITGFRINGTLYEVDRIKLSAAKLVDKAEISLNGFKCKKDEEYSFDVAIKYSINNVGEIAEGEVPLTGKCRET